MKEELISIIIPAYNSELELEKCVHILMQQTYSNLEVIIVNDGSKDKTKIICDLLVEKTKKISVIHQENAGVSAARNAGIKKAKGKWIVFLDADDRMVPEAIENAVNLAERNKCDTVCWNCYKECEGSISKYPPITPDNSVYQDKQICTLIEALYQTRVETFYPGHMFRAVWGKLLSAEVIRNNKILFPLGMPLGEDAAFLVDYFCACNKVLLVNQYWNFYKISSSSAVRQYRNNLKELQSLELALLREKIQLVNIDIDTILLNQYLQFDYQYIHHLYQAEKYKFVIFKNMVKYVKKRKYQWKHFHEYNRNKVHKKSLPIVWAMVHNCIYLEVVLCMIREQKHR